jgi:hypothetical protein
MEQSPAWEANRFSATQEIPRISGRTEGSVRIRGLCNMFKFLRWGIVTTSPKPQAGRPPFVGCPRLLIQYIQATLHICPGDRN